MSKHKILNGAIHIHTILSDGSADIDYISKTAKNLGLDYIIISDHNKKSEEGFFNGVYVISAEEITPNSGNHYLAFNTQSVILPDEKPQIYVDEVRKSSGFGFMAHPFESEKRKNTFPSLKWKDNSIVGDGLELWNWFSSWADNVNDANVFTLAYAYFFKHRLISAPCSECLKYWDSLNNSKQEIFPALCGVDAHALLVRKYILPLKIFPYKTMLNTFCNSLSVSDEADKSFEFTKNQILNALKNGNNIMYNRHEGKIPPEFYVENSTAKVNAGEVINLDDNTYLKVKSDKTVLFRVFRNGELLHEETDFNCNFKIVQGGKYRVEVYRKGKPWAFSNPVCVC